MPDTTPESQPPPAAVAPVGCGCDRPNGPGGTSEVAVVGVRLRGRTRLVQFNANGADFEMGERVVVESDQGLEIGEVIQPTTRARRSCAIGCMKKVLRVAAAGDEQAFEHRAQMERDAAEHCRVRIRERSLAMRLVRVEAVRETRKITFYFTAEGRVDFRELVRDLASRFHSRIEMRQIGVRDEARIRGGYGDCGRALCCSTFLKEFAPVSIRMAREQNLSLNPSKISGMCGRLKCCLRYEYFPAGGDTGLAPEDEPLPPAPTPEGDAPPA